MTMKRKITARNLFLSSFAGVLLLLGTTSAAIQDHGHGAGQAQKAAPTEAAKSDFAGDPYLLDTDPVTGKKLGAIETQPIVDHEGRELLFANEENVAMFKKDPAKYLKAVDEKMIAEQLPYYPLTTCPISGSELGGMGKPIDKIYKNRLVRFCCGGCPKSFEKEMGKYMAELDAAVIAKQAPTYRAVNCPVTGKKLDSMGGPYDVVLGNRLVRLCCKGCVKRLRKDPLGYFAKLDA